MLRIILPILLLFFGLGGGIGAAVFLGSGNAEEEMAADDHSDQPDDQTAEDEPRPVAPGSAENLEYVRLNNQFVVPVVRDAAVRYLVVMSLTVEIDAGQAQFVFNREPRLRDAFLRAMFSHANAGGFEGAFTSPSALNPLREGLRDAAYDVLGDMVYDVLIVDIVRQDA